jgi:hypothetical protein
MTNYQSCRVGTVSSNRSCDKDVPTVETRKANSRISMQLNGCCSKLTMIGIVDMQDVRDMQDMDMSAPVPES